MEQPASTPLDRSLVAVLQNGPGLFVRCGLMTAGMQDRTCVYMARVLMQTGLHLDSLNISAFVRAVGKLQLGIHPVWLMLTSVTYPTNLAPPTLLFPATTLRVPSTVDPVLQVGRAMATAVRMWTNV